MKNLHNANKARAEKALNKLWNFKEYGITNFKHLIDTGAFSGSFTRFEPTIEWSRTKYNRMDNKEQEVYEEKIENSKKDVYYLKYKNDESFTKVSPFVYTYFNEWEEQQDILNNPDKYCTEAELDRLFNN